MGDRLKENTMALVILWELFILLPWSRSTCLLRGNNYFKSKHCSVDHLYPVMKDFCHFYRSGLFPDDLHMT